MLLLLLPLNTAVAFACYFLCHCGRCCPLHAATAAAVPDTLHVAIADNVHAAVVMHKDARRPGRAG